MAHEDFEYRGHRVAVDTYSVGKKFGWEYQIDDEQPVPIKESALASEDRAVAEGKAAAISAIEARKAEA